MDLNYGATPDLQLTAVLPIEYRRPRQEQAVVGLGNIELAAKHRFLRTADVGWDIAIFPRVFLPIRSALVGEDHHSVLAPILFERDRESWSIFGGGGCAINRGGDSPDYCLLGWAVMQ